jgi:predicted O-methyltransferase YrrM
MIDNLNLNPPSLVEAIEAASQTMGFTMASDQLTGSLLRTLAASKPAGQFLEIGTGTGLSAAWLLAGMDSASTLITVDRDEQPLAIARRFLQDDPRIAIHLADGKPFIDSLLGQEQMFDFIFADSWPGKFAYLQETLLLLKIGGFYVIDDLLPQPSWPEVHPPKVARLIATLEQMDSLHVTKLNWATGIIIATRKP